MRSFFVIIEDVDYSDTDCGNDGFDNMNSASVDVNQESFDNNSNIVQENGNLSQLEAISMNNDDTCTLRSEPRALVGDGRVFGVLRDRRVSMC